MLRAARWLGLLAFEDHGAVVEPLIHDESVLESEHAPRIKEGSCRRVAIFKTILVALGVVRDGRFDQPLGGCMFDELPRVGVVAPYDDPVPGSTADDGVLASEVTAAPPVTIG